MHLHNFIVILCFITFTVLFLGSVKAHICFLREKYDPESGRSRWWLPTNELCHCQRLVKPRILPVTLNPVKCFSYMSNETTDGVAWFLDDPGLFLEQNKWTPIQLDDLLSRQFCCELHIGDIIIISNTSILKTFPFDIFI